MNKVLMWIKWKEPEPNVVKVEINMNVELCDKGIK